MHTHPYVRTHILWFLRRSHSTKKAAKITTEFNVMTCCGWHSRYMTGCVPLLSDTGCYQIHVCLRLILKVHGPCNVVSDLVIFFILIILHPISPIRREPPLWKAKKIWDFVNLIFFLFIAIKTWAACLSCNSWFSAHGSKKWARHRVIMGLQLLEAKCYQTRQKGESSSTSIHHLVFVCSWWGLIHLSPICQKKTIMNAQFLDFAQLQRNPTLNTLLLAVLSALTNSPILTWGSNIVRKDDQSPMSWWETVCACGQGLNLAALRERFLKD